MATIEGGSSEMIFVYNSKRDLDKQALAYISVFSDKIVKLDVQSSVLEHSFLVDLSSRLGVGYQDLVDHECEQLKSQEYYLHLSTPKQYIDLIVKHPDYLKTPVLIYGDKAHFISKETDLLQLSFL